MEWKPGVPPHWSLSGALVTALVPGTDSGASSWPDAAEYPSGAQADVRRAAWRVRPVAEIHGAVAGGFQPQPGERGMGNLPTRISRWKRRRDFSSCGWKRRRDFFELLLPALAERNCPARLIAGRLLRARPVAFHDQRSVMNRFTIATKCATRRSPVATIRTPRISITTFIFPNHRKCSTDWWGASRRGVL